MKFFGKQVGRQIISAMVVFGALFLFFAVPVLADTAQTVELTNPLGAQNVTTASILTKTGEIVKYAMGILGVIALSMFIYGGFLWLTSTGASDKIEKGKKIFVWAVIGLAVIFSSYLLVNLVIGGLTK